MGQTLADSNAGYAAASVALTAVLVGFVLPIVWHELALKVCLFFSAC
jgi:hypothetical protein